MARHRTHSIEFKRQVAQDYLAGDTLHSLARRHDLSRNLIRIWIQKFEGGAFDDESAAVDTIEAYEARLDRAGQARERGVGGQVREMISAVSIRAMFSDQPNLIARQMLSTHGADPLWRTIGDTHAPHGKAGFQAALRPAPPAQHPPNR